MIENSLANDTITLSLTQTDGDRVLSVLTLEYPNLPNEIANIMSLRLVDAIKAETAKWSAEKASGAAMVM
jgi:hypothetical protein